MPPGSWPSWIHKTVEPTHHSVESRSNQDSFERCLAYGRQFCVISSWFDAVGRPRSDAARHRVISPACSLRFSQLAAGEQAAAAERFFQLAAVETTSVDVSPHRPGPITASGNARSNAVVVISAEPFALRMSSAGAVDQWVRPDQRVREFRRWWVGIWSRGRLTRRGSVGRESLLVACRVATDCQRTGSTRGTGHSHTRRLVAEAELLQRSRDGVHRFVVPAGILVVRFDPLDGPVLSAHGSLSWPGGSEQRSAAPATGTAYGSSSVRSVTGCVVAFYSLGMPDRQMDLVRFPSDTSM